jgi:hypothetical protein
VVWPPPNKKIGVAETIPKALGHLHLTWGWAEPTFIFFLGVVQPLSNRATGVAQATTPLFFFKKKIMLLFYFFKFYYYYYYLMHMTHVSF